MSAQILDFGEKMFLEAVQIWQENTCARVYLLTKLQTWACNFIKKEILPHTCFPVNFEKVLRTHFLTEHLRWLLL